MSGTTEVPSATANGRRFNLQPRTLPKEVYRSLATDLKEIRTPRRFSSIDELIYKSRREVGKVWEAEMTEVMHSDYAVWAEQLSGADGEKMAAKLLDFQKMDTKVAIRQFSDLQPLRKLLPIAWYDLTRFSMARQYSELEVLTRWVNELPEESFRNLELSREEMMLACEIGLSTGPLVNKIFMRQMAYADTPEGAEPSPNANVDGSCYVYEEKNEAGDYIPVPFIKNSRFPEWPKLVSELTRLSKKTRGLAGKNKLPPSYHALADFLDEIVGVWASEETDFGKLLDMWDNLFKAEYKYVESGCPITIDVTNYTFITGPARKVDADLRVGIITDHTRAITEGAVDLQNIAYAFSQEYDHLLAEPSTKARLVNSVEISQPGSNGVWASQGEADGYLSVGYIDVTDNVIRHMTLPFFERVFGYKLRSDEVEKFLDVNHLMLIIHELAHNILSVGDKNIIKKTGYGEEQNVIEELKADTLDFKILRQVLPQIEKRYGTERILQALVVMCLDYVNNRDSGDGQGTGIYSRSGRIILNSLLQSGILVNSGRHYEIKDTERGFAELIGIGEEVCGQYLDGEMEDEQRHLRIQEFVRNRLLQSDTPELRDLIAVSLGQRPVQESVEKRASALLPEPAF